LHKRYLTDVGVDEELDCLSPDAKEALIGYEVVGDICEDFDVVDLTGFQLFVAYLDDLYGEARNAKTKSGRHAPFHESVGNKAWLIYWHERLEVTGNRDLANCAYGELDDYVRRLSTDGPYRRQRKSRSSSTASERSLSPMPGSANVRTRKHSAVEATEEAARSIAERNNHLTESDEFDRLMELKKMREKKALKIAKCRLKYQQLKQAGDQTGKLELIKRMANAAKKIYPATM
jgi:hypothetical protein